MFHVSIWEAWSFVWGDKPTKAPPSRGDGTVSQSTDVFTKFNEVNLQLQGNDVNLIKAKSAIFTLLSKFNAVPTKSSPS